MEFHDAANIFPMLEGDEYRRLRDDIAQNGLIEPIWLHEGKILDGRNRYTACLDIGIEPRYREYTGSDPIGFVVSLNLSRRHLTSSQRAVIALEVERQLAEDARKRQQGGQGGVLLSQKFEQANDGKASEQAARMVGTNRQYVSDAKNIVDKAPELIDKVRSGELTIPQAMHQLRKQEQDELRKQPIPIPIGKFNTIVIDPPWPIEKIERNVAPNQYAFDYPTMTLEEIKEFSVPQEIAADNAHLFLWTTQKFLPSAFDIMNTWGFKYVFTMVWHKPGGFQPYNLPQYNCEFVLYGRKGTPKFLDTTSFFTCFDAPRTGHSVKPDDFYETLSRVCPEPRIDVFSRTERQGYSSWGNEV